MLTASNPFARGYDNLHIERLVLIVYADGCLPCFRPIHESQAHLSDDMLQLVYCVFNDDFALISEGQFVLNELAGCCPSNRLVHQVIYAVVGDVFNEQFHLGDFDLLDEAKSVVA